LVEIADYFTSTEVIQLCESNILDDLLSQLEADPSNFYDIADAAKRLFGPPTLDMVLEDLWEQDWDGYVDGSDLNILDGYREIRDIVADQCIALNLLPEQRRHIVHLAAEMCREEELVAEAIDEMNHPEFFIDEFEEDEDIEEEAFDDDGFGDDEFEEDEELDYPCYQNGYMLELKD
jgi:hypothetical protein